MKATWLPWTAALCLMLAPRIAGAQCSGGSGGGEHQHSEKAAKGDRKTLRAVDKLLAEDRSRSILLEAVLADSEFMRLLIGRMASMPEWRALVVERIDSATREYPPERDKPAAAQRPDRAPESDALYRCPMHPEVTSKEPGKCPRCGMTLRRSG